MRTAVYDDAIVTDELIAERAADAARREVVATSAESTAKGTDLHPDLHHIQAPALVLWGRHEWVMPLEWDFDYARLAPDIEFHVLPRYGHRVQIENGVDSTRWSPRSCSERRTDTRGRRAGTRCADNPGPGSLARVLHRVGWA